MGPGISAKLDGLLRPIRTTNGPGETAAAAPALRSISYLVWISLAAGFALLAFPRLASSCENGVDCQACYGSFDWVPGQEGFRAPWDPVPGVVDVWWDPQHVAGGRFGNAASSMTVGQAKALARRTIQSFHAKAPSRLILRWRGSANGRNVACPGGGGATPHIVLTTADVNGGRAQVRPHAVGVSKRMDCVEIRFDPDIRWRHRSATRSFDEGLRNDFVRDLLHELGHAMRWAHNRPAKGECEAVPWAQDDDTNTGGVGPAGYGPQVSEKAYMALDYGLPSYAAWAPVGRGVAPANFNRERRIAGEPISPVAVSDGDDANSAYVFNEWRDGVSVTRAVIFEPDRVAQDIGESWHRPDVTRTVGWGVNWWAVARLTGDSRESRLKEVTVAERRFGQPRWFVSSLGVSTPHDSVAIAYDPRTALYLVAWTADPMALNIHSRPAGLPDEPWTDETAAGQFDDFALFGGADLACSRFLDRDGRNCVLVYQDNRGNARSQIRFRRFGYDWAARRWDLGPERRLRVYALVRPTVSATPVNSDVHFTVAYDFGGRVHTRRLNRDNDSSARGASYAPPRWWAWLRPAGIGSRLRDGVVEQTLVLAR